MTITLLLAGCFNEKLPEVQQGEFPFKLVYEYNGETEIIEDTVFCEFYELTPYYIVPGKYRMWNRFLKSGDERYHFTILKEENKPSIFNKGRVNIDARVYINYGAAEYYMGDPNSKSLTQSAPSIEYIENYQKSENVQDCYTKVLSISDAEKYFGIQIKVWEFSKPIKNFFK
ncbi:hypothetical protein V6615_12020 [Oscillospiraceae bacterium PP1C4]